MFYWMYRDTQNFWRWRLYAGNNRIIAESGESYHNRGDCESAIHLVKASQAAPIRNHDDEARNQQRSY